MVYFCPLAATQKKGRLNFISPWFDISLSMAMCWDMFLCCSELQMCFSTFCLFAYIKRGYRSLLVHFPILLAQVCACCSACLVCHYCKQRQKFSVFSNCLISYSLNRACFSHPRHHSSLLFFSPALFISLLIPGLIISLLIPLWYSCTLVKWLLVFVS